MSEESLNATRQSLLRKAEDRFSKRLQSATSIGASDMVDSALDDHRFATKRIWAMSDADLEKSAEQAQDHAGPRP